MRLFGGERIQNMMEKLDLDEDTPIENKMLTRAIENAQTTVESRNFQSRKTVLEYDDVMNKQREIIYAQRRQVLDGLDIKETVLNMMHTSVSNQVALAFGENRASGRRPAITRCSQGMEGIYFAKGAVGILRRGTSLQDRSRGLRRGASSPPPKRPTRPRSRRSRRPSCGSWSVSSCSGWWTNTGWTTSTPWTI